MRESFSDQIDNIRGEVSVKPFDRDGQPLKDPYSIFIHPQEAKKNVSLQAGNEKAYLNLHGNLVVNLGRQTLAYLIGGRDSTTTDWTVTQSSWGIGEEAPRFTDSTLSPQLVTGETSGGENEIAYNEAGDHKKNLVSVDFPNPFIVRFESVLGADEGTGYLIREMGLWTGNGNLFARKVFPAINKSSDFGLSFLWKVRV